MFLDIVLTLLGEFLMTRRLQKLLEPKEARIGAEFLKTYIRIKSNPKDPIAQRFTNDKRRDYSILAHHLYGYDSYRNMPPDAKAFVSICANTKKKYPSWTFEKIVNEKLCEIETASERLYASMKALADEHYWKVVWPVEVKPVLIDEWYAWAEKYPELAYSPD